MVFRRKNLITAVEGHYPNLSQFIIKVVADEHPKIVSQKFKDLQTAKLSKK